jgi:hypothetical protein
MSRSSRWKARIAFIGFIVALTIVGGAPNKWDPGWGCGAARDIDERLATPVVEPTPNHAR